MARLWVEYLSRSHFSPREHTVEYSVLTIKPPTYITVQPPFINLSLSPIYQNVRYHQHRRCLPFGPHAHQRSECLHQQVSPQQSSQHVCPDAHSNSKLTNQITSCQGSSKSPTTDNCLEGLKTINPSAIYSDQSQFSTGNCYIIYATNDSGVSSSTPCAILFEIIGAFF